MRFPNRASPALLRTQHLALDLGAFQKPGLLPETPLSPLVYSPARGQRSGEVSGPESQFPQVVTTLLSVKRGLPLSPECYNLRAVLLLRGGGGSLGAEPPCLHRLPGNFFTSKTKYRGGNAKHM